MSNILNTYLSSRSSLGTDELTFLNNDPVPDDATTIDLEKLQNHLTDTKNKYYHARENYRKAQKDWDNYNDYDFFDKAVNKIADFLKAGSKYAIGYKDKLYSLSKKGMKSLEQDVPEDNELKFWAHNAGKKLKADYSGPIYFTAKLFRASKAAFNAFREAFRDSSMSSHDVELRAQEGNKSDEYADNETARDKNIEAGNINRQKHASEVAKSSVKPHEKTAREKNVEAGNIDKQKRDKTKSQAFKADEESKQTRQISDDSDITPLDNAEPADDADDTLIDPKDLPDFDEELPDYEDEIASIDDVPDFSNNDIPLPDESDIPEFGDDQLKDQETGENNVDSIKQSPSRLDEMRKANQIKPVLGFDLDKTNLFLNALDDFAKNKQMSFEPKIVNDKTYLAEFAYPNSNDARLSFAIPKNTADAIIADYQKNKGNNSHKITQFLTIKLLTAAVNSKQIDSNQKKPLSNIINKLSTPDVLQAIYNQRQKQIAHNSNILADETNDSNNIANDHAIIKAVRHSKSGIVNIATKKEINDQIKNQASTICQKIDGNNKIQSTIITYLQKQYLANLDNPDFDLKQALPASKHKSLASNILDITDNNQLNNKRMNAIINMSLSSLENPKKRNMIALVACDNQANKIKSYSLGNLNDRIDNIMNYSEFKDSSKLERRLVKKELFDEAAKYTINHKGNDINGFDYIVDKYITSKDAHLNQVRCLSYVLDNLAKQEESQSKQHSVAELQKKNDKTDYALRNKYLKDNQFDNIEAEDTSTYDIKLN